MKVALICPADFTVFLCCKWIIKHIQDKGNEVVVVSPLGKDKFYLQEIKKFNVKHIEIRMNRHINLFDDVNYIFDLIKIFKNEKINSVFAVCTKPNIFAPIAAKISGINDIFISIWGRGTAFLSRSGINSSFSSSASSINISL